MSLKHTYTLSVKNDAGGTVVADTTVYTADAEENVSEKVTASTTKEIDLPVTVANIESFYIESDQDVTLKINSAVSPVQTIALTAKKAYWWNSDRPDTNPLTTDITKLYFVNAGLTDANVKAGFLVNQGV